MAFTMAFSLVPILLTLILAFSPSTCVLSSESSNSQTVTEIGFRVDLTHVDASRGFTHAELVQRVIQRSKKRAANLASRVKFGGPISVYPAGPAIPGYVLEFAIGTPPLYTTGIFDTGSDLIWTQCKSCIHCLQQPFPLYDPFTSSSFSNASCSDQICTYLMQEGFGSCINRTCDYDYHYGGNASSTGFLGNETFTFGSTRKVSVPHIGFGCGKSYEGSIINSSGIVGFANSPISLISQLGVTKFSYCYTESLHPNPTKSPLFLGSMATLTGMNVQTTPIILSETVLFYYISLKGITVGNMRLSVPPETFELKKNGSGGTIIDSGTSLLLLIPEAYGPLLEAFKSQVKLPFVNGTSAQYELGLKICFATKAPQTVSIPKLVFHLEGADWEMPRENYMHYDKKQQLYCVMVMVSEAPMTTLGNVLTQNMHILYDLKNKKLSFAPTKCSEL